MFSPEFQHLRLDTGGAESYVARFSSDGRYVVLQSNATNLSIGDTNDTLDIFRKDLVTGAITRVSTSSTGAQADAFSTNAHFSTDGRYVVFESSAPQSGSGDTNHTRDILRRSRHRRHHARLNIFN